MIATTLLHPTTLSTDQATQMTQISPREACAAWARGAVVADLRTERERRTEGVLPGAIALDDLGAWIGRLELILVCRDGSRAAGIALDLRKLWEAPIMVVTGGYAAWRRAVWRDWGELLMFEPATDIGRFFRLLR